MSKISKILRHISSLWRRDSFALNDLDLKMAPYLNYRGGFFVEAGANDGLKQSNTLYFEKYQEWRGLLIEPVPELARQCAKNRPKCAVENIALSSFDSENDYVEMRYCDLMSLVKGAMKTKEEEEKHINVGCDIQQIETHELRVPAKPLSQVLDDHAVEQIDFFSLDVEGYELQALKGIDFDKHQPRLMLIEARYRDEIDSYLKPIYEPTAELSHHDVLYRRAA